MTVALIFTSLIVAAYGLIYYTVRWLGGGMARPVLTRPGHPPVHVRAPSPPSGRGRRHSAITSSAPASQSQLRVNSSPPADTSDELIAMAVGWKLFLNEMPVARFTDVFPRGGPQAVLEEWTVKR